MSKVPLCKVLAEPLGTPAGTLCAQPRDSGAPRTLLPTILTLFQVNGMLACSFLLQFGEGGLFLEETGLMWKLL